MFLAMKTPTPRVVQRRPPAADGRHPSVFATWRRRLTATTRYAAAGDFILVAFLLAQVLDGALTYVGVSGGAAIELNPLLVWYFGAFGIGPTLAGAKVFAGACAVGLHLARAHLILATLTILYLSAAVVPWAAILTT